MLGMQDPGTGRDGLGFPSSPSALHLHMQLSAADLEASAQAHDGSQAPLLIPMIRCAAWLSKHQQSCKSMAVQRGRLAMHPAAMQSIPMIVLRLEAIAEQTCNVPCCSVRRPEASQAAASLQLQCRTGSLHRGMQQVTLSLGSIGINVEPEALRQCIILASFVPVSNKDGSASQPVSRGDSWLLLQWSQLDT